MSLVLALYLFLDNIVSCLRLFAFQKKVTKDENKQTKKTPAEDVTESTNL